MKNVFRSHYIFLVLVSFAWSRHSVLAAPSANDLLQTAKNNTTVNCTTHHMLYRTATVIQKPGQAPISIIQTTEIFKKKPNLLKIVMDDGIQKKQFISRGDGYMYVMDPTSGKFQPIKSPYSIDPFQQMSNSLTDFDGATAEPVGDHNEITLRGGKLPKNVDHAKLVLDPQKQVVTHMEQTDTKGNTVMSMDANYQKIGSTQHVKHMHTEGHTAKYNISADMDVLTNEVDQGIPDSAFNVK